MNGAPDPFDALIEGLKADGLTAEADELHSLLHETAWTTGAELLGELGLKMKAIKTAHWKRMSAETRQAFRPAAAAVHKAWPAMWL